MLFFHDSGPRVNLTFQNVLNLYLCMYLRCYETEYLYVLDVIHLYIVIKVL